MLFRSKSNGVKGEILTNKMNAHNTFEELDIVKVEGFTDFTVVGDRIRFTLPPCSVLHLEVE